MKKGISIGIILLFIVSAVSPMVIGYKSDAIEEIAVEVEPEITAVSGPMDSPWPMKGHDIRHTGSSPYGIADNPGFEIWKYKTQNAADCSPAIDNDGTIYIGSTELYAVYPNGTLKWKYDIPYHIETATPAIDENGIVYIGTIWAMPNYLYAIYTTNGTLKWKYYAGDSIHSSSVIGDDGTIYFGNLDGYIHAVNPNGTRKWRYKTGSVVTSSPAIGEDGTVYCGSHDDYLYAFYPNNGTVKWAFKTGSWVHGSPTIGDDETIYIGSDDGYLYALYPNNGTMKWRCQIGATWASPALDENGTLYIGVWEKKFYAIYPNGTIKWTFDAGDYKIWGSSAALSAAGTIYFGTCDLEVDGGIDIIALNPDGTEKWRKFIKPCFSSPAIGEDGTVYIGSYRGLLAFGNYDPNAPEAPTIDGPASGKAGTEYDYNFTTTDPNDDDVYYYIEWGDGSVEKWIGPYLSGEEITLNHTWDEKGTYIISARAKDTDNLWGAWGELEVTMPKNKPFNFNFPLISWWLERFPQMKSSCLAI